MGIINYPGRICLLIHAIISQSPVFFGYAWQGFFGALVAVLLFSTFFKNRSESLGQPVNRFQWLFSDRFYIVAVCLGIFLLRIPNLLLPMQNVDETEWIATAASYKNGSVLWKSVNGHTSGPLIFASLNIMLLLGDGLNYVTIRLFGLLFCIIPSVYMVWRTLHALYGSLTARIAILPLFIFFVSINYWDLVAYNSEHVPMLLTSVSIFFLFTFYRSGIVSKGKLIGLGAVLGLMPYAKLQVLPIGAFIGLLAIIQILALDRKSLKDKTVLLLMLIGATFIGSALVLLYLLLHSALHDFWLTYIYANWLYVSVGIDRMLDPNFPPLTMAYKLDVFQQLIFLANEIKFFFLAEIALVILTILAFAGLTPLKSFFNKNLMQAVLIFFAACWAVITPGNRFWHYMILFIIPFSVFIGVLIGTTLSNPLPSLNVKRIHILFLFSFLCIGTYAFLIFRTPNVGIEYVREGHVYSLMEESLTIKKYTHPNERMSIWGWASHYYIETGLIPASSNAHPFYPMAMPESPYMAKFTNELKTIRPVVFFDAVYPKAFLFKREKFEYENYPELKEFINSNYQQVAEFNGERIFVLNSRLEEMKKAGTLP